MLKRQSLMKKIFLSIIFAIIFAGCGIWGNFTTYFNLYYNTSDLFEQAETAIKEQKVDLFSTQEIVVPGSANQQLIKVIEKASKILQFHDETAFVDEALLMLGKSFFYQRNYQKALRKFNELIASDQEGDLVLETQLWVGKTEMKLKEFEKALQTLTNLKTFATEEGEDELVNQSFIEEIKYYITIEDYQNAISLSNRLLEISDDNELNAIVAFQLGKFYIKTEQQNEAVAVFEKVFSYSPTYETELNTLIELGKALRSIGKLDRALSIFDDLRSEDKYKEAYDIVDVELGLTYKELGEFENAIDNLQYADTAYANSLYSGIAKYELGLIFEKKYLDFDSAFYYYSRAARAPAPSEYTVNANEKLQLFTSYNNIHQNLEQNKKQFFYLQNPEAFVEDSIEWHIKDSIRQAEVGSQLNKEGDEEVPAQRQSLYNRNTGGSQQTKTAQQLPPQRPILSEDSLKSVIVKNEFELANLFFTEFDLADSAFTYYMDILTNYPNSTYQARTLYGLGSYYQFLGNEQKADSIFNYIYENFKNESIVNAAANKINKALINLNYDPAEELYASAEQKLLNKNLDESLTEFYNIYEMYPKSPIAPKALLATGFILENEMSLYDSAASVYDTIVVRYPVTIYAQKVQKKLTAYKQEQERIRKAALDSIKAIEQKKVDSLKSVEQRRIADSLQTVEQNEKGEIENMETKVDSLNIIPEKDVPDDNINLPEMIEKREAPADTLRKENEKPGFKREERLLDSLNIGKPKPPGKI